MKKLLAILAVISATYMVTLLQSCDYGYLKPVVISIPDTVSFTDNILPIFTDNCALSGCHETGGIAPDLTPKNAYSDLWLYGFVDTTDVQSSILYSRLASTSDPMPPTGNLGNDKIQLVLAWIEQGARDN